MRLTLAAFNRRARGYRQRNGSRLTVLRMHPGRRCTVTEPVEIVEQLLPADCEHDDVRVVRAGVFDGRFMARCRDCGIPGPVVDAQTCLSLGVNIVEHAGAELLRLHPRASFREARDEGGLWGWAETYDGGKTWLAMSGAGADHAGVCIGALPTADLAIRTVLDWWRRPQQRFARVGCMHCKADPMEVVDFCPHCALSICGPCLAESTESYCGTARHRVVL